MEQCEKWLNRDGKDILRPELCNWKGNRGEDGFRKGWKVALEEVLTEAIMADDAEDIVDWIKKELGE